MLHNTVLLRCTIMIFYSEIMGKLVLQCSSLIVRLVKRYDRIFSFPSCEPCSGTMFGRRFFEVIIAQFMFH